MYGKERSGNWRWAEEKEEEEEEEEEERGFAPDLRFFFSLSLTFTHVQ